MEQLTPSGVAGIAVVRVAPAQRAAVMAALSWSSVLPELATAAIRRAQLHCDGKVLDDVLVVARGAAGLELHVHGSPAVLAALRERFGMTIAPAQSPAAALLQHAVSPAQLDLALEQLGHDFAADVAALQRLPEAARAVARAAALARSRSAMAMAQPLRVVLIGQQNAGKSSLLNHLVGRGRALTGPLPGLTRDPVSETTTLAGYPYELVDTAGEGQTRGNLDRAAIELGRERRVGACVVLVVDGASGPTGHDRGLLATSELVVATKSDLPRGTWPADFPCALWTSTVADHSAAVRARFGELLRGHRQLPPAGAVGGFAALTTEQFAALTANA
jgi:small GTP-binding protein